MPYCTPPIVNSWSKKGELPNTSPERVERPITNRTGDVLAAPPSWPSGAYQRPSRSSRWKFPEPPSGPPDCESPMECIELSQSGDAEGGPDAAVAPQRRE